MNELKAAIEAAGLPEPNSIAIQWEGKFGGFTVRNGIDGWFVEQWENVTESWDPVPVQKACVATPAEAVAHVKEWMDEH